MQVADTPVYINHDKEITILLRKKIKIKELAQKYMHWNIEKAFGILHFGYCRTKVLPSGESSWSTLPWFVQVLRRTSTSQKMLAWTVRQVWQAGVRVPRVHHLRY